MIIAGCMYPFRKIDEKYLNLVIQSRFMSSNGIKFYCGILHTININIFNILTANYVTYCHQRTFIFHISNIHSNFSAFM